MSDEPSEKNAEEKEQENGSEERSSDAAISEPSFNQLKLTETLRKKLVSDDHHELFNRSTSSIFVFVSEISTS